MTSSPGGRITIAYENTDLDDEALQEATRNLARDIREVDGVEHVDLVAVDEAAIPAGAKAVGGYLLGILQALIDPKNLINNLINLLKFLGSRLQGGIIKLKVKVSDKEVEIEVSNQKDLLAAEETVKRLMT